MELRTFARLTTGLVIFFATGCSSYYRINDQASGRVYYTTDYDRSDSGAIIFEDAKTRSTVTLPSSEIREISRSEYETSVKK